MTQIRVPRPPLYGTPHTRTDTALLELMQAERCMHEKAFCSHAWEIMCYLEVRLMNYPAESSRAESRTRSRQGNLAAVAALPREDPPDHELVAVPAVG